MDNKIIIRLEENNKNKQIYLDELRDRFAELEKEKKRKRKELEKLEQTKNEQN
jgi:predicted phage gp36 major capsid-like protein